jgi:hypothetical protein
MHDSVIVALMLGHEWQHIYSVIVMSAIIQPFSGTLEHRKVKQQLVST